MQTIQEKRRVAQERVRELRRKYTPAERRMAELLNGIGAHWEDQKAFIAGSGFAIVDFWLPKENLCIEVDGGYHWENGQRIKDARRDDYLEKYCKVVVIRFKNEDVMEMTTETLEKAIKAMVDYQTPEWAAGPPPEDNPKKRAHLAMIAELKKARRAKHRW